MSAEQSGANGPGNPDPEQLLETRTIGSHEAVAGMVIGPYHLLQRIGEGGMGEVWLAEQKHPVRRRVAIKLIKIGMDTREVVARFESERQALALMDHPAIAKVFDAGSTPQGRPYFAMEYVTGVPITEYCDKHKLTLRERLALFIHVCEGVQHAHQKAIIHRDLKPSNILVGEVDGRPLPKIIDFGVAKATSQRLTADTMFTRLGTIIGTPGYMSPEQADSTGVDVDTRADVYSLGVVLYELLVGTLPLDFQKLAFDEILRRLREEDAPRPSTRLRLLGKQSSITARGRSMDFPTLVRQLHGDLDAITLKALEKDRSRRYAAASELVADIRRYLRNEPVSAHPASAAYRARKYIRRHRMGVTAAAALAVVLISFAGAQTFQLRRTMAERDRANRERDRATRITAFMTEMFKVSDPSEARGNSITAREILDRASKEIDTGLAADPRLQAQMMSIMGNVYDNLGLFSRAQPLLAKAAAIRRQILGPQSPETLASMDELAKALRDLGRIAEAEKIEREALETERRFFGTDNAETARSMSQLAWTLEQGGHFPEAEKLDRESLAIERRVLGPENIQTLSTMSDLASVVRSQGNYVEAERMDRETLEKRRRALGADHPKTLDSRLNLATDLASQDRHAEAEKLDRENLKIARRIYGPEHPATLGAIQNLSDDLVSEGLYTEAEKLGQGVLETERRVLGPEHPQTLDVMEDLAKIHRKQGDYAAAEELDRQTLEIRRRVLRPEHPQAVDSMLGLAKDLDLQHAYAEAEKLERNALAIARRGLGPENPRTLQAIEELAVTTAHLGRYAEAENLEREALGIQHRILGLEHAETASSTYNLARFAVLNGKRDEPLSLLREAVDHGLSPQTDLNIEKDPDFKSLHGDPRFRSTRRTCQIACRSSTKHTIGPRARFRFPVTSVEKAFTYSGSAPRVFISCADAKVVKLPMSGGPALISVSAPKNHIGALSSRAII